MCTDIAKAGECGTRCKIRSEDDKQSPEPNNQTRKQETKKKRQKKNPPEKNNKPVKNRKETGHKMRKLRLRDTKPIWQFTRQQVKHMSIQLR